MPTELFMGVAKRDITPEHPVPLAGFKSRTGNYEDVARRLYLKVWLFGNNAGFGGGREHFVALVQADIVWWGPERAAALKSKVADKWGISAERIMLHASHTHSGPQTSQAFSPLIGTMDAAYVAFLEEELLAAFGRAIDNMVPVRAEKGTGSCAIGIYRRKLVDGKIEMAPNPEGPVDQEVQIIRFTDTDDRVKGVWVHYTCHPTTTDASRVSSEFPGVAMEMVEAALGGDAVASYLQGCCADIRPALIHDGSFFKGGDEEVAELGSTLGAEVLRIMGLPMAQLAACPVQASSAVVPLAYRRIPDLANLHAEDVPDEEAVYWREAAAGKLQRGETEANLELSRIDIADNLTLLGMNGEISIAYGMYVKQLSEGGALPLAYSNGMIGYVPTAVQLQEGGYEADGSIYYFGLLSQLADDTEARIRRGLSDMLASGRQG